MTRHYSRLIMIALLGVAGGCSSFDQYGSGGSPYYSGNQNNSNNPYGAYGVRYPSNGYETEYRKSQKTMSTQDSQSIVNEITQRMLNGGWYPESNSGNQLVFTRVRDPNGQEIYYKTVYTLVPSSNGYVVYANMKLKTMDSPYRGSLDQAAHDVDDRTDSILKAVKKSVEQKPTATPIPKPTIVTSVPKTMENTSSKPTPWNLPANTGHKVTPTPLSRPTPMFPTASPTKVDTPVEKTDTDQTNSIDKQQNKQDQADKLKAQLEKAKKDKKKSKDDENKPIDTNPNTDEPIAQ